MQGIPRTKAGQSGIFPIFCLYPYCIGRISRAYVPVLNYGAILTIVSTLHNMIKVALVEDNRELRENMERIFSIFEDVELVFSVADGAEAPGQRSIQPQKDRVNPMSDAFDEVNLVEFPEVCIGCCNGAVIGDNKEIEHRVLAFEF